MLCVRDIQPGQIFFVPSRDENGGGNIYLRNLLGELLMLSTVGPSPEQRTDGNDGTENFDVEFDDYGGDAISLSPHTEVQLVKLGES